MYHIARLLVAFMPLLVLIGCSGQHPAQPVPYKVTATPNAQQLATLQAPQIQAPAQVAPQTRTYRPRFDRNQPTPDIRQYEPMPLPVVPEYHQSPRSDQPPPGVYVDPNIPGNGPPPFPAVMYPVGLIGDVYFIGNELYIYDEQLGTKLKLLDPGRTLDGWIGTGLIDVSGVYDGEQTLLICRAVPYGTPIEPRVYTSGACELH